MTADSTPAAIQLALYNLGPGSTLGSACRRDRLFRRLTVDYV
jgi:hypothetical protein